MPATYNFKKGDFAEGDDCRFKLNFTDPTDGSYYSWIGVTKAWITLKKNEWDDDTDAVIQLDTVADATQIKIDHPVADVGQAWVWFKSTDCAGWAAHGAMYYDFQVLKDGLVNTLVEGTIPFGHEKTVASA